MAESLLDAYFRAHHALINEVSLRLFERYERTKQFNSGD